MWLPFYAQIATRINFQSALCKWYVNYGSLPPHKHRGTSNITSWLSISFWYFNRLVQNYGSKMMNDEYIIYGYYGNVCKWLASIDNLQKYMVPLNASMRIGWKIWWPSSSSKSQRRLWSFTLRGVSWCSSLVLHPTHPDGPRAAECKRLFREMRGFYVGSNMFEWFVVYFKSINDLLTSSLYI